MASHIYSSVGYSNDPPVDNELLATLDRLGTTYESETQQDCTMYTLEGLSEHYQDML
jgi:hypothetical protein